MSEKESFQTTIEKQLQEWKNQVDEYSNKLDGLKIKPGSLTQKHNDNMQNTSRK
ncbi:MAG: hypothetical protein NPIRA02_12500 [Nitrospirales bacterium]|nr:MAG: hypothetical protein NPIRA02_12500 [Nitrospirales bacterium]